MNWNDPWGLLHDPDCESTAFSPTRVSSSRKFMNLSFVTSSHSKTFVPLRGAAHSHALRPGNCRRTSPRPSRSQVTCKPRRADNPGTIRSRRPVDHSPSRIAIVFVIKTLQTTRATTTNSAPDRTMTTDLLMQARTRTKRHAVDFSFIARSMAVELRHVP
jgi:hypothetical protein